jgi:hypothetical protein
MRLPDRHVGVYLQMKVNVLLQPGISCVAFFDSVPEGEGEMLSPGEATPRG